MFTITNVDDIEEYLNARSVETQKTFLYTVFLSVKEKPLILRELSLMGINQMTLFPSIDGICGALKSQFFSASSVGLTFEEIMKDKFGPFMESSSDGGLNDSINRPKKKRRRRQNNPVPSEDLQVVAVSAPAEDNISLTLPLAR